VRPPAHLRTAAEAAVELSDALAAVAAALVTLDVDAMLAAETALGRAVTGLGSVAQAGDRGTATLALQHARAELLRCRRLGASFSAVSRALLQVGDASPDGYTRGGGYVERAGVAVSVRVHA
jgi:hypothetical protein